MTMATTLSNATPAAAKKHYLVLVVLQNNISSFNEFNSSKFLENDTLSEQIKASYVLCHQVNVYDSHFCRSVMIHVLSLLTSNVLLYVPTRRCMYPVVFIHSFIRKVPNNPLPLRWYFRYEW
jgi:hypothetical protein